MRIRKRTMALAALGAVAVTVAVTATVAGAASTRAAHTNSTGP
jgi:hypothetical protein